MLRIMLVDDEFGVTKALRRTLTRGLTGQALEVETFNDPNAALERATEVDFALVISDFRMPPMDGVSFLKRFRVMQPDTVRVILSASSDVDSLLAAINEAGAQRYLLKPWEDDDLLLAVRDALLAYEEQAAVRRLAEGNVSPPSPEDLERRRLEAEEPGITAVRWGPAGEVLLDEGENERPRHAPPA